MALTKEDINEMSDADLKDIINLYLDRYEEDHPMRQLVDENNVYTDIMHAAKGKKSRKSVLRVIGDDYDDIFSESASDDNKLLKAIRNVQIMFLEDTFHPKEHEPIEIVQPYTNKVRQIIVPDFQQEAIIHHAIIRLIMPDLKRGMYKWSCAGIKGRGIHYARRYIKKAVSNDPKNTKYVFKMDIRHFFDSIPHRELKKRVRYLVKDEMTRKILFRVIDSVEKGVPLGFYTSQWLANYYLQPLDHYIKERILDDCGCNTKRTKRHGAVYYVRYMDDMVMFGPNKKELHKMHLQLEKVLHEQYGLKIKYDWQIFRFDYIDKKGVRRGRPLDFLGFQFYHDKVTIRKRIYKRIRRVIKHLIKLGIDRIEFHDAAVMMSYYGFIYWSNARGLYTKLLRPYIKLKDLKQIIKDEMKARMKADPTTEED